MPCIFHLPRNLLAMGNMLINKSFSSGCKRKASEITVSEFCPYFILAKILKYAKGRKWDSNSSMIYNVRGEIGSLFFHDCTEILCLTAVVIPKWWFPNHCLKHSWKFYFISSNFSLYIIIIRMPIYPIYPTCLCRIPHPNWAPNTRLIKTHCLRGKQLPCITKGLFTHVMIHDLFRKKIMKTRSLCC